MSITLTALSLKKMGKQQNTPTVLLSLRSCGKSPEAGVVGTTTGRLDVALQQEQQRDSVAEPVAEAGVVVLLPLNLAAHGVDDLVKQHRAVCLEDLPLETAAEDEVGCHWSALMEAQVICTKRGQCYVSFRAAWYITRLVAKLMPNGVVSLFFSFFLSCLLKKAAIMADQQQTCR